MRKHTMLENANHHSNIPYTFTGFGANAKGPALTGTQGVKATEAVMVTANRFWRMRKLEFDDDLKNIICNAHNSHLWLTTHIIEWP
eukprot:scaffold23178_cov124-Skeletonema_dohrnii-CCMP3373.AAC.2